jgi:hypothetical protein
VVFEATDALNEEMVAAGVRISLAVNPDGSGF